MIAPPTNSLLLADLASADLEEIAWIFARAYLRHVCTETAANEHQNSQNSLDEVGAVEAPCIRASDAHGDPDMRIEPDGTLVCAAHASPTAREMSANERLDHAAETGERVRCAKCATEAKR